jgi:hypothetical protein
MTFYKLKPSGYHYSSDNWLPVLIQGYVADNKDIVLTLYDCNWKKLPDRERLTIVGVNDCGYIWGRLYTESISSLQLLDTDTIPQDILRDIKIQQLLT